MLNKIKYIGMCQKNKILKLNYPEKMIGQKALVCRSFVGTSQKLGRIKINGQELIAYSNEVYKFECNEFVRIKRISGNLAYISPVK